MNTSCIKEFFSQKQSESENLKAETKQRRIAAEESIRKLKSSVAEIDKELEEKTKKRDDALSEGLNVEPIDGKISDIRSRRVAVESEIVSHQAVLAEKPPIAPDYTIILQAAEVLDGESNADVDEVDSTDEVLYCLGKEIAKIVWDGQGHPTEVSWVSGSRLSISGAGKRFGVDLRPSELGWLPKLPRQRIDIDGGDKSRVQSHDMRYSNRVFLVRPEVRIVHRKPLSLTPDQARKLGIYTNVHIKLEHESLVLERLLVEEALGLTNGVLDLEAAVQPSGLHRAVQEIVLSRTTTEVLFPTVNDTPTSDVVYSKIKNEWSLFVRAPWSSKIDGALCKLKYTVESGERPRFWQLTNADHYGYRVRTRDHSWITGVLFVDRTETASAAGVPIQLVAAESYSSQRSLIKVGRMYLTAEEERDKRL